MTCRLLVTRRPWRNALAACVAVIAVLALPVAAAALTVTLTPSSADTYLDLGTPSTAYGGSASLYIQPKNNRFKRAILQFDVSSIPADAVVNSATLRLYMTNAPGTARTWEAHRMTRAWSEPQATWNAAQTGVNWTAPGGDFSSTVASTAAVNSTSNIWVTWDVTADVRSWVAGTTANYGTLLKDSIEGTGQPNDGIMNSSVAASNQPQLVVDYTQNYTMTVPGGSAVVMGSPDRLNFTIAADPNNSTSRTISNVSLTFPYAVSGATAPSGWVVSSISGNTVQFHTVDATNPLCSSEALARGASAVFGVTVTASAAAAESTDTISSATLGNDCASPGANAYAFGLTGSFPTWTRRGLDATLTATPATQGTGNAITLSMLVTNRTTASQASVAPATPTVSGTGAASLASGPTPASATIAANGGTATFTWTYTAGNVGSVSFTDTATNGSVSTLSIGSNAVQIGNLAAVLSVSPTTLSTGSAVTVTMSVTNNGGSPATNVVPSALTPGGTASATLTSSVPAAVGSLAVGQTASFTWTYTITGSPGQTYSFSGSATATGGLTSNTATSGTGTITSVAVSVSPASVPVSSAATLTYALTNQSGHALQTVAVVAPTTGFGNPGASTGPAGWTTSKSGGGLTPYTVTFQSPGSGSDVANGGSASFVIPWSAVPSTANTYSFTVNMTTRDGLTYSSNVDVAVNQYTLVISASPIAIPGDGVSTSTVLATLTNGATPVSGQTITLSTTAGVLSATTGQTNASGQVSVTLTSAATTATTTATVAASYGASTSAQTTITFQGVAISVGASPTVLGADGQSASTVTITLTLDGAAYAGKTVTLATTGGTLGGTSFTTDANGHATTTLTAPLSTSNSTATLTASYAASGAPAFTGTTTVSFQGVVLALTASPVTIAADGQSTSTITATLTQGGVALAGKTVAFSTTNASGQTTVTLTAPVSATNLTATVTGTYNTNVVGTTSVTLQGVAVTISASPSSIPADGQSTTTVTVTVKQNGAGVNGATVTLTKSAGTLSSTTLTTDATGTATATLTSTSSATDVSANVTATYRGAQATTSVTFQGITLSLTPTSATVAADGQSSVTLSLTFRYTTSGAVVPSATAAIALSGAGSVLPASAASATSSIAVTYTAPASGADGVATVTVSYGGQTATATITYLGITLALTPATPAVDADGQSTVALSLTFRYANGGGAIPSATATIALTGAGAVSPTSTASSASPITVTYTPAVSTNDATATVTATYLDLSATSTITVRGITVTLTPGTATVDADGQSTTQLTLTARYTTSGTPLPSATSLALAPAAVGGLSPTSATTATTTVTFTAAAQATYTNGTVTATYKGLSATSTLTLRTVSLSLAADPTTILADGASTSAITATLAVGGSAASNVSVSFGTSAGSLAAGSQTTDGFGVATTTLTSSTSTTDVVATLTATYKGVSKTVTVTFSGVTLSLSASPGTVAADGVTPSSVTALVLRSGAPQNGVQVSFATTEGTLSAGTATTAGAGQATVTLTPTASKTGGSATVTATYQGLTKTVTVNWTGITIAEVGELHVISTSGTNAVYWTAPGSGYYSGAVVLRKSGALPQPPADGATPSVGGALGDGSTVVATGSGSAVDSALANGVTYYYRAFGRYGSTNLYSTAGVSVDAAPTSGAAGQPKWAFNASAAGVTQPQVDGSGGLYWGGTSGGLVATSVTDGTPLWTPALTGTPIDAPPVMADIKGRSGSYAIVTTRTGAVAAIDTVDGSVAWETAPLGTAIAASVTMQVYDASDAAFAAQFAGDVVFVGTRNGSATNNKLYALDAGTGAVRWTFNASGATAVDVVTGAPWVDYGANRVLFTTHSNGGTQPSLWALSTLDGSVVKTWSLGDIDSQLIWGMDNVVYVPTAAGKLYAVDLASLSLKWTAPFDAGSGFTGTVWEDWALPGQIFFSTADGNVWAVQSSGGTAKPTLVWKTAVAGATAPFVLGVDGLVYVGSSDGKVHELRTIDGVDQKQATLGDGSQPVGPPTWDYGSGWLYAGTASGKVFAIGTPLP